MTEPGFPTSTFEDEYAVLKEGTEKAKAYTIYLISGFPEQFVKKIGNDAYAAHIESLPEKYDTEYIKFLPKQYKTFADGAIYSLALEIREPFYNCLDCKSEWIIPLVEGEQIFDYWWGKGYKVHIHITGDLAFEEFTSRGVPVSLHSDFAMAPAEPLLLAWVAANRVVASGKVLVPEQSIAVYEAMKGITLTAARTFEMEHEIGSIKVGKQANFTLLEQNPFKIDSVKIKDIAIAGIVYKGQMKLSSGKRVGADRDAHGCIGSAGYSWCEQIGSCERPWELASWFNNGKPRRPVDKN